MPVRQMEIPELPVLQGDFPRAGLRNNPARGAKRIPSVRGRRLNRQVAPDLLTWPGRVHLAAMAWFSQGRSRARSGTRPTSFKHAPAPDIRPIEHYVIPATAPGGLTVPDI